MKTLTCINSECGRQFQATERFLKLCGGLCRPCAGSAESVERTCEDCGETFREYPRFLRKIGAFAGARKRCPTCHDRKVGKDGVNLVEGRDCLQYFPLVKIVDLDMEQAEPCPNADGSGRNPVKRVLKNQRNKSYDGSLTIYDYRSGGERGPGSAAVVRVMKVTHAEGRKMTVMSGQPMGQKHEEVLEFPPDYEYLVLESPEAQDLGKEPEAQLVCAHWHSKHNASGGVVKNEAHWSRILSSRSRSGRHSNGTLVAIVDNEHPVLVRQDHQTLRYAAEHPELEEACFRDDVSRGPNRVSFFVPGGDADLLERLISDGWLAKLIESGVVVSPHWNENEQRFELPTDDVKGEVQLVDCEAGGGYTNRGWAVCVADLNGEALRPFATAGYRGHLACGTHAWFGATGGLVTVQANYWSKADPAVTVSLCLHRWVPEEGGHAGRVESRTLFSGVVEELSGEFDSYRDVVEAAVLKAQTYHCRSMVFSK